MRSWSEPSGSARRWPDGGWVKVAAAYGSAHRGERAARRGEPDAEAATSHKVSRHTEQIGGANALNLRQEFAKLLRHLTKHALARMPLRKSTRIIGGALEPPCKIRPRPFNLCRTRRFTRQATERLRDELQRLSDATGIRATRDH